MGTSLWPAYLRAIAPRGARQIDIAEATGQKQATISRWLGDVVAPDEAAVVAGVAKAFGHPVLEAFVAAGFITEDEAGRGLTKRSRDFLAHVRGALDDSERAEAKETMRAALERSTPPRRPDRRKGQDTA